MIKAVLYDNMDAMSLQMDCYDNLKVAMASLDKSMAIGRKINGTIEGQLRLFRINNKQRKDNIYAG